MKAGTLKDWTKSHKYNGCLRTGEVIHWTCDHAHSTSREALACAHSEEGRRVSE